MHSSAARPVHKLLAGVDRSRKSGEYPVRKMWKVCVYSWAWRNPTSRASFRAPQSSLLRAFSLTGSARTNPSSHPPPKLPSKVASSITASAQTCRSPRRKRRPRFAPSRSRTCGGWLTRPKFCGPSSRHARTRSPAWSGISASLARLLPTLAKTPASSGSRSSTAAPTVV